MFMTSSSSEFWWTRHGATWLACGYLFGSLLVGCDSGPSGGLSAERAETVAKLKSSGAAVEVKGDAITAVDFYGCQTVGESLPLLVGVSSIELLNFSSVPLTDDLLANLKDLKNLKHLALNDTTVGDQGVAYLKDLKSLEVLNLDGTQVTDAGLEHLSGLPALTGLALYRTAVSDEGLTQLANLKSLKWLRLSGPGVTAEGVAKLQEVAGQHRHHLSCRSSEFAQPVREVEPLPPPVACGDAVVGGYLCGRSLCRAYSLRQSAEAAIGPRRTRSMHPHWMITSSSGLPIAWRTEGSYSARPA